MVRALCFERLLERHLRRRKFNWTQLSDVFCWRRFNLQVYCHCPHQWIPFAPNAFAGTARSVVCASSHAYPPYSYESTSHEVSRNRNETHFRLRKLIWRKLATLFGCSRRTVKYISASPWTVPHGYWRARTFLLPNRTNSVLPTTANGTWVFIDVFTSETDSSSVGNW